MCFVLQQVTCGMHHATVVATPLSKHRHLIEEKRRSQLLSWGKGRGGQLGQEAARDHSMPQVGDYSCGLLSWEKAEEVMIIIFYCWWFVI